VEVKVDVSPSVKCKEKDSKNTSFEVELDIKTKPSCSIREKKTHHECESKCATKCTFVVDVDVDFKCESKITKHPGTPRAKFDLDVKIETESSCKAKSDH
jgi:hypothetical protein